MEYTGSIQSVEDAYEMWLGQLTRINVKTVPDRWEEGGAGSQAMFDPYLEPRPARAPVRLSSGNLMWRPVEIGLAVLAVAVAHTPPLPAQKL